jgi:hypothetical protein
MNNKREGIIRYINNIESADGGTRPRHSSSKSLVLHKDGIGPKTHQIRKTVKFSVDDSNSESALAMLQYSQRDNTQDETVRSLVPTTTDMMVRSASTPYMDY